MADRTDAYLAGLVLVWFTAALAFADDPAIIVGHARVVDGDTLAIGDQRVRLFGIDALEASQTCQDRAGRAYTCGGRATAYLRNPDRQSHRSVLSARHRPLWTRGRNLLDRFVRPRRRNGRGRMGARLPSLLAGQVRRYPARGGDRAARHVGGVVPDARRLQEGSQWPKMNAPPG